MNLVNEILVTFIIIFGVGSYYLIPCFVCAYAAQKKGLSTIGYLLFAIIFTPVIGFLAVIAIPSKKTQKLTIRRK